MIKNWYVWSVPLLVMGWLLKQSISARFMQMALPHVV